MARSRVVNKPRCRTRSGAVAEAVMSVSPGSLRLAWLRRLATRQRSEQMLGTVGLQPGRFKPAAGQYLSADRDERQQIGLHRCAAGPASEACSPSAHFEKRTWVP